MSANTCGIHLIWDTWVVVGIPIVPQLFPSVSSVAPDEFLWNRLAVVKMRREGKGWGGGGGGGRDL